MASSVGKKRRLDEVPGNPKTKKTKVDHSSRKGKTASEKPFQHASSNLVPEEVDFPRGGGTSFTALEVKAIRAEAAKEADHQLFKERDSRKTPKKQKVSVKKPRKAGENGETIRVEHLNYKRIVVGMKILSQVVSVQPLGLIVSLTNQLMAHIPITHISSELTSRLESIEEGSEVPSEADSDEEPDSTSRVLDLLKIFHVGQFVRAVVTAVHEQGSTNVLGIVRGRDELQKSSGRVELSLQPEKVNEGVVRADMKPGFALSAAVRSVEDHGYILNLGIPEVSGFLSFGDARKRFNKNLPIGFLLDAVVTKMPGNSRTCTIGVNAVSFAQTTVTEVTNATSLLPGALVLSLITAITPSGLNLQVLGYYQGTVDQYHLLPGLAGDNYKVGQKVKARILYNISQATTPRFALSLADHVVSLRRKSVSASDEATDAVPMEDAYPVGTTLEAVKVVRVEADRGLVVTAGTGIEGFVHISHVSDDHVPTLSPSSGPWKVGTIHRARVTGYFACDGLLQLSLRLSVLQQKFLQAGEVEPGEILRGTIKRLTSAALFVSISGNVDAVIWPNHYADIQLKHPQKRFKPGGSLKCRVLVVEAEKKRIVLTAKKTLIESAHPTICSIEDAKVGLITHAVAFRASGKGLQVEFYNNVKAFVPAREASEASVGALADAFPPGKVVQVRILSVDLAMGRIVASIRQASPNWSSVNANIGEVEIGHSVEGLIASIQKDKLIVTLQPTQVPALLSFTNLANRRGIAVSQLRASLKIGDKIQDLVVTTRNPEKGFVLVATKPKEVSAAIEKGLTLDGVRVGQIVGGRVLRHVRHGTLVKVSSQITGMLYPTDISDNYESGGACPSEGTTLKAAVVAIDKDKKQLTLSTRPSRLETDFEGTITDREITTLEDLKPGATVRGFIKSVVEHGLFVTLGRGIDARVQIKNLFDEFIKDWRSRFVTNQVIKGRILSIDTQKNQVEMTLRSGDDALDTKPRITLSDIAAGQKVDGVIKKIEDYGLFIEIQGSKLRGLCHKSEISDSKDADVTMALRSFREGDRVKTMVVSVDIEKRRISFGLKPSYFGEADFQVEATPDEDDASSESLGVVDENPMEDLGQNASAGEDRGQSGDEGDVTDDDEVIITEMQANMFPGDLPPRRQQNVPVHALELRRGFQWSVDDDHDSDFSMESGSGSDEDETAQPAKSKKRKRNPIEQDHTADMHTKAPESNADFERLLLGSPNSSYLWVQYMSFQLQISEVDKAREVAKRALQTINFRDEQERFNVWLALLNLENIYGTEGSLDATFKDAARHMDSKTVHLRMAAIFEQSEKHEKAQEQFAKTSKKFGYSSKVWTLFGEYCLKRGNLEAARKLLPRSLQSLEKRKHLKTISKFAQLEYRFGDPERGKTIFEGMVDSHPKRWDLWSIYLNMEANQGNMTSVRQLFDRLFTLKMTSHKAKAFFKRWLDLERRMGDEEGQTAVKAKAVEWTQRAADAQHG